MPWDKKQKTKQNKTKTNIKQKQYCNKLNKDLKIEKERKKATHIKLETASQFPEMSF